MAIYIIQIMTLRLSILLGIFALLTTGCAAVRVTDYGDLEPKLSLESFFEGTLTAHGVIKDRSGRVIRTFNADISGDWQGNEGVLREHFLFNDGSRDYREWTLTPSAQEQYHAVAGDVVGTGSIEVAGNSAFLNYVLQVPYGESTVDVRVDDRMYLVAPGVLVNESEMKKFGVRVGSILLVILKAGKIPVPGANTIPDQDSVPGETI